MRTTARQKNTSGGTFHVHGPHDHPMEHAARGGDAFAARIAVTTAIFASVGALMGCMGGATQNDALMHKSDAAIRKTEASDQLNCCQAGSGKQNLAEPGAAPATGEQAEELRSEAKRYAEEKAAIMDESKKLEARAKGGRGVERGIDARPPSLGAGDDADPDRDRPRRHHAFHPQQRAQARGLRHGRRRSAPSRSCAHA